MVKVNGEARDIAGKTVDEMLAADGYDVRRVAIEKNGEIVPKARYADTVVQDGDSVEVVSFVGGG